MTNKEIAIKLLNARRAAYESLRSAFIDSDRLFQEYDIRLEVVKEILDDIQLFLEDEES